MTPTQQYGVHVSNSRDVRLSNLSIHQGDNATLSGAGVFVRNGEAVTVEESEIHHVGVCISVMDCTGAVIDRNNLHDIASDGIDLAGAPGARVTDNAMTDFYPPEGAHPDGIQFWATALNPLPADIWIEGNAITRGAGFPVQGIFGGPAERLKILNNVVSGPMFNGISVSGCMAVEIAGNYVRGFPDMGTRIIVRGGSENVVVHDNAADQVVEYVDGGALNLNFLAYNNRVPGYPLG
jgi:nitrous oxidase accessory protein NosD